MEEKIKSIEAKINAFAIQSRESLEQFRLQFISKKGEVTALFDELKSATAEQKKWLGKALNELKKLSEEKFRHGQEQLESTLVSKTFDGDLTLPVIPNKSGSQHPLSLTRYRIIEIFERLGFNVEDGPEIEDDWHNFTALNFPENHPAREMQDTFFVEKNPDVLLRTHTSNVQIRLMKNNKPPFRAIMPGRVYRNEAISARAHCFFHQVEGLYVDTNVGFADLKQTLYHFAKEMFGKETKIRLRPSFFPFTEPSAEIDISCLICHGKGCNVCKYSGWVEIAGSGMVHPNVLRNCGIDPEVYTGFAFGMGIERITMLRYSINDLRLFSENDIRFLKQFKPVM
ncbi:MAG TPA: phenylalanine--tRNA ligase subunit alpha [Cyclobacteriaceae bacterium]|jgi:phenylalanyl-tRNA synthetase alpha chain|nr:phenylalanine--tRNA ligase subunit alpha [Cytophagales bacterium]HMR56050.1 phenylalanine--tRNA ligase subunit alpha [Cyclobacteriaceae bacterium]HNT48971.1 phenylalanine--tRNA ligase subunit alpha [Cyclobacteriaceae bacterium]HRE67431.1 phenylalanine--tRNA ligase subunit alpha [Cyclobacteriaceae bacterium]HRF33454.1 phenylalanine--tRNA ligase subunit alpha [Cyclobacteriaceae bacterium]